MTTPNAKGNVPALLMPKPPILPKEDGITHINISTTGKTDLGRKLVHYPATPFVHPIYGPFKSMEGFWGYVKAEEPDDAFRDLAGSGAKAHARTTRKVYRDNFIDIINEANYYKIMQNADIKAAMIDSTLPFEYYYLFGPTRLQIFPDQAVWLTAGFESIRRAIKAGKEWPSVPPIAYRPRS